MHFEQFMKRIYADLMFFNSLHEDLGYIEFVILLAGFICIQSLLVLFAKSKCQHTPFLSRMLE